MQQPTTAFLTVALGSPVTTLLHKIGTPDSDGSAQYDPEFEGVDQAENQRGIWRRVAKEFMLPAEGQLKGGASALLHADYRADTSEIWRVHLLDGSGRFSLHVPPLPAQPRHADLIQELGAPTRTLVFSDVLEYHWWLQGEIRSYAEAYCRDYPDLLRTWKAGEIQTLVLWSSSLGPSGYDHGAASYPD